MQDQTVPQWIIALGSASQCAAVVLLVLFLLGRVECQRYVYTVLWMSIAWWVMVTAWYYGSGASSKTLAVV